MLKFLQTLLRYKYFFFVTGTETEIQTMYVHNYSGRQYMQLQNCSCKKIMEKCCFVMRYYIFFRRKAILFEKYNTFPIPLFLSPPTNSVSV